MAFPGLDRWAARQQLRRDVGRSLYVGHGCSAGWQNTYSRLVYQCYGCSAQQHCTIEHDGTLDTAFDPNANDWIYSLAVQPDGRILAAGFFTSIGGQPRNHIARLDAVTGAADAFDPNANNVVYSLAVQPDGKILVGGAFTNIGGQARSRLARIDAATGLADSFDPDASGFLYPYVFAIAVQSDGKIVVGGDFRFIGGQIRNHIARLDAATGLADAFDPNATDTVGAIAVQADAKIVAGGDFHGANSIGGQTRNYIARLDAVTGLADAFDPNANGTVDSIAIQSDGKIIAGGLFAGIGGSSRNYLARLDGTTGSADAFNPNPGFGIISVLIQADGKILAGGGFTSTNTNPLARFNNDTAALQDLTVTQNGVTWTRGGSSSVFTHVTFESSTDNVNYSFLGSGTPSGSNWTLTGLNLPTGVNIYVRARGYQRNGFRSGSESTTESVRNAFIAGPTGTLTPTTTPTATSTATNTPTPTPTATPCAAIGSWTNRLRILLLSQAMPWPRKAAMSIVLAALPTTSRSQTLISTRRRQIPGRLSPCCRLPGVGSAQRATAHISTCSGAWMKTLRQRPRFGVTIRQATPITLAFRRTPFQPTSTRPPISTAKSIALRDAALVRTFMSRFTILRQTVGPWQPIIRSLTIA